MLYTEDGTIFEFPSNFEMDYLSCNIYGIFILDYACPNGIPLQVIIEKYDIIEVLDINLLY